MKQKARYVHDEEVRAFLATVMETSETGRDSIENSAVLWRAQRGYVWRKEMKDNRKRMKCRTPIRQKG
jgi:hypothetical protein